MTENNKGKNTQARRRAHYVLLTPSNTHNSRLAYPYCKTI